MSSSGSRATTPPPPPPSTLSTSTTIRGGRLQAYHHEDLLPRKWRAIAHSIVVVTSKAEKVAKDTTNRESIKELNEATIGFLKNRLDWDRSISYLEAKLEGRAAEMEALQHYVRSHPSLGRKRKRDEINPRDAKGEEARKKVSGAADGAQSAAI